jgi:NADPH:quinone reductase-like Zn-dependent oxidoreductase
MLSSTPRHDDLATLAELLEAGKVTPLLDRTFPLGQVPEAIAHMLRGGGRGKIVITV